MKTNDKGGDQRIRICIAGAAGRMGSTVARAVAPPFVVSGAVESASNPNVGMTLKAVGSANSDIVIESATGIEKAARDCDVFLSFTSPEAELANLPLVVGMKKPVVVGTTGFTPEQWKMLRSIVKPVPAVVTSNFSIGATFLCALTAELASLPASFDFSIMEAHHRGKRDAPSGTASSLAEIIRNKRGYTKTVYGRSGISPRAEGELDILSLRGGGIPGQHVVLVAGEFEMIKLEHTVFSRTVFAEGALLAARWVARQKPGFYGMKEVLGIR
jgi:4-hydroxy-tetrahydrodipicolinate reductase